MTNHSWKLLFGTTIYRTLCAGVALAFVLMTANASELIKRDDGVHGYPAPTEAQIAAGEALVARIAHATEHTPISDARAWFSALGIGNWTVSSTSLYVGFLAQNSQNAKELAPNVAPGIRFSAIRVAKSEAYRGNQSQVVIDLERSQACICADHAIQAFSSHAETISDIEPDRQYGNSIPSATISKQSGEQVMHGIARKANFDLLYFTPDRERWPLHPFVAVSFSRGVCASRIMISTTEPIDCRIAPFPNCRIETIKKK